MELLNDSVTAAKPVCSIGAVSVQSFALRLQTASRWWPIAVLGFAIGLLVAQSLYFHWTLDDAYITFAYAQNWVQGHGLVFNVGERVEGYTCFLWVVLSAVGLALGANIVWWSTALGILSALGAVFAAWQLARELVPLRLRSAAVFTALIVGGYPVLAWWAASGMETALFTCLVTVAIWRHVRDGAGSLAAPACLALASMTRPEGWLLAGLLCLDTLRTGSWRQVARYIGVFVTLFGPYYAWRCWYYGYPVPNTFYAKVGHTEEQVWRGVTYARGFLQLGAGGPLVVGALTAAFAGTWRRTLAVYTFLVTYTAYVILVGGDVFLFFRFFVPLVPILGALAVVGVLYLMDRVGLGAAAVASTTCGALTLAFLVCCRPLFVAQAEHVPWARSVDLLARGMCVYLREHTAVDDQIATGGIGLIKFCTGRNVIDILGIADKHIAHQEVGHMGHGLPGHEKYDSEYVLARWPKYIEIPGAEAKGRMFPVPALEDMWEQPLLRRYYVKDRAGYRRIE
jgi:arabinofuranosyltransferase